MTLQAIAPERIDHHHREALVQGLAERIAKSGQVTPEQSTNLAEEQLADLLVTRENYFFSAGEDLIWLMSQQPGRLSIMLPADGTLSDALLEDIESWAAQNDAQSLRISLFDAQKAGRFENLGYTATNLGMEKQINGAPTSSLTLVPMSPERFDQHLEELIIEYGQERVKAGNFSEENWEEQSRNEVMQLVPQKLDTPGHFGFTLRNEDGQDVGILWIARMAFTDGEVFAIYDIVVDTEHRRKGYGTQALLALEAFVVAQGLNRIMLHVFGHNHGARTLYEKMGYQVTHVVLQKTLETEAR